MRSPNPPLRLCLAAAIGVMMTLRAAALHAQVNIESLRPEDDLFGLAGSIRVDLAVRTGNVEIVEFALTGRLDRATDRGTSLLIVGGDFGFQGGERFSNAALIHLRHGYHLRPRLRPEVFTQVNYSKPRSLDFRWLAGGGMRVGLLNSNRSQVWLGTGYMFEYERLGLAVAAVHSRRTSVSRWNNYLSSRVAFDRDMVLTATAYLQPQLGELGDVRSLLDVDLAVPVSQRISLAVSFDARYDSGPPDDVESLDTALKVGVGAAF